MAMQHGFIGRFVFSLLCVLALAGCSDRIDGSSEQAFKASIEKISGKLPQEERAKFRKALAVLAVKSLNLEQMLSRNSRPLGQAGEEYRKSISGKTALEVIAMAEVASAERKARAQSLQKSGRLPLERPAAPQAVPAQPPIAAPTDATAAPAEAGVPAPQS